MSRFWHMVWLFTLASMAGFLLESGESLFSLGYVQNRQGLLYGPFTPVYGAGAVLLALLFPLVQNRRPAAAFCCAALAGTGVEYLWSLFQELLFGVRFWDYRHFRFHLHGRINLPFALLWGLLGLGFWLWFYPRFRRFCAALSPSSAALVGLALAVLLTGDALWSSAALLRRAQRKEGVAAFSPLGVYLDQTWSDEALNEHFPAMREIKKAQA